MICFIFIQFRLISNYMLPFTAKCIWAAVHTWSLQIPTYHFFSLEQFPTTLPHFQSHLLCLSERPSLITLPKTEPPFLDSFSNHCLIPSDHLLLHIFLGIFLWQADCLLPHQNINFMQIRTMSSLPTIVLYYLWPT